MRTIATLCCFIFAAISTRASAAPYRVMDVNRDALQALDSGTVKKVGGVASAWLFTQYWRAQPFDEQRKVTQVKALAEFDCENNRMRLAAVHFFVDRDTPIPSGGDVPSAWSAIVPDAWIVEARNAACDGTYTSMGAGAWNDYDTMVSVNREIANAAFPARP